MEPRRTKPRRTRPDPEPIERAPPNLVRKPAPTPHSPEREGEVSARGSRRPSLNETTLARPAAAVIGTVRTADLNTRTGAYRASHGEATAKTDGSRETRQSAACFR